MNKVIEVSNLNFSYGTNIILQNINVEIYKGDFVAIVGPNGNGKTTFLKIILGEIKNYTGQVKILNTNIQDFKQWYKFGYVSQNKPNGYNNFPATVEEIVTAHLYKKIGLFKFTNKNNKLQVYKTLDLVGMGEYAKRKISDLSGGQQQRVFLACALVNEPEVILLDEPTTGVDEENIILLYELLQHINKTTKVTIVMITHDVYRTYKYVKRTLCLENHYFLELGNDQLKTEEHYRHKHDVLKEGDYNRNI